MESFSRPITDMRIILHAPPGVTWPTSDNPFMRVGVSANGAFSFEGGWDVPGTKLFMPLSSKHLQFNCVGSPPPRRGTTLSLAEGHSKLEAIHCLKRYIAREVYGIIQRRNSIINQSAVST